MSEVTVPLIRSIKTGVDIFKEGIEGRQLNFGVYRATEIKKEIPDIAGYI